MPTRSLSSRPLASIVNASRCQRASVSGAARDPWPVDETTSPTRIAVPPPCAVAITRTLASRRRAAIT